MLIWPSLSSGGVRFTPYYKRNGCRDRLHVKNANFHLGPAGPLTLSFTPFNGNKNIYLLSQNYYKDLMT